MADQLMRLDDDDNGSAGSTVKSRPPSNGTQSGYKEEKDVGNLGETFGFTGKAPGYTPYQGGATPGSMQVNVGTAAQSAGVNAIDPRAAQYNQGLAAQLWAQAQGKGPSIAQMQLQQATDQGMRQQAALAASGRNPAGASYNAMQNQGTNAQTLAGQSAMARLAEQYQAQQGLAGMSAQMQNAYGQNAAMGLQNNQYNAGAQNQNMMGQAQINAQQNQAYNDMMARQSGQYQNYQQNKDLQRDQYNFQFRNQMFGKAADAGAQGISSAAGGAAGAASDRRLKKNVTDGASSVRGFLDRLKAKEYNYKDPDGVGQAPGRHVSVMAQDLEKTGQIGKSMVENTPHGKMVHYGRGLATMLAAQADLHQRIKALEQKGGK